MVKRLGFWRWKKVKGLILSSPSNPTGAMLTPEELKGLCEYCDKKGITFISDEIYHHISYGKPEASGTCSRHVLRLVWRRVGPMRVDVVRPLHASIIIIPPPPTNPYLPPHQPHQITPAMTYSDKVIVINSFSKYYSMTGWRLGWMVAPKSFVPALNRLSQNFYLNVRFFGVFHPCISVHTSRLLPAYIHFQSPNPPSSRPPRCHTAHISTPYIRFIDHFISPPNPTHPPTPDRPPRCRSLRPWTPSTAGRSSTSTWPSTPSTAVRSAGERATGLSYMAFRDPCGCMRARP